MYAIWLSNYDSCDGVVDVILWDETSAVFRWEESLRVGGIGDDDDRIDRGDEELNPQDCPYDCEGTIVRSFADLVYDGHYVSLLYRFPLATVGDWQIGDELFFIWTSERGKKWFARGGVLAWASGREEAMAKARGLCFLLCGKRPVANIHYKQADLDEFERGGQYLQIALKSHQNLVIQRCFISDGDVDTSGYQLIDPIISRTCGPYNGHVDMGCVPLCKVDIPEWKMTEETLKLITERMVTLVLCLKHLRLLRPLRMIIACQAYQDSLQATWKLLK